MASTKLLRQLMTFLTVQLLFDKLRHTFLMLLFCTTYLTRKCLKHTVECILLKINKERHRSFHHCCAVLSTHSFFFRRLFNPAVACYVCRDSEGVVIKLWLVQLTCLVM
jgi:hypothetical protein